MTEDTDDTDDTDRMERANRIREMREGRRSPGTNGESDADEDATGEQSAATATAETDDADRDPETTEAAGDAAAEPDPDHGFEFDDADSEDTGVEATAEDAQSTAAEEIPVEGTDGATDAGSTNGADTGTADQSPQARAEAVLAEAGITQTVSDADATAAVDRLRGGERFSIPDQATTVRETDEGVVGEGAEASVAAARAAAAAGESTYTGEQTRVLEFELGAERFCLDIDYIEEIVELENMTRVPNSPSYVEGVVDLRGQVTAIINPKDALDVGEDDRGDLIIVFDSEEFEEQGHLGWVVDEVRQVTPVAEEDVNDSPDEDAEHINGVINRDEEDDFIVWTSPDLALHSS